MIRQEERNQRGFAAHSEPQVHRVRLVEILRHGRDDGQLLEESECSPRVPQSGLEGVHLRDHMAGRGSNFEYLRDQILTVLAGRELVRIREDSGYHSSAILYNPA